MLDEWQKLDGPPIFNGKGDDLAPKSKLWDAIKNEVAPGYIRIAQGMYQGNMTRVKIRCTTELHPQSNPLHHVDLTISCQFR